MADVVAAAAAEISCRAPQINLEFSTKLIKFSPSGEHCHELASCFLYDGGSKVSMLL